MVNEIMKVSTLFIDLDNTLWDFLANSKEAMAEVFPQLGLEKIFPSYPIFWQMYYDKNNELWELYHHGEINKEFLITERFASLFRAVGYNDENNVLGGKLNDLYLAALSHKSQTVPGAIELLDYLSKVFPEIYVLSNGFKEVQYHKAHSAGLDKYFTRMVLSDEIGVNKPNRELFDYALQVSGGDAESTVMIGDNYDADILGAHNAGWKSIYFDRYNQAPTNNIADITVSDLLDIINCVTKL